MMDHDEPAGNPILDGCAKLARIAARVCVSAWVEGGVSGDSGHELEGEIAGAVSGDLVGGWAEKAVRQGLPWLARKHAEAWDNLTEDQLHQVAIDMGVNSLIVSVLAEEEQPGNGG